MSRAKRTAPPAKLFPWCAWDLYLITGVAADVGTDALVLAAPTAVDAGWIYVPGARVAWWRTPSRSNDNAVPWPRTP